MTDPRMTTLTLTIPRRLESPNTWNGAHWRVKHRISQEWEQEIFAAVLQMRAGDWCGPVTERRRVTFERHVPSARHFIRDDDNLRWAPKPALDALTRLGLIRDDSRKWLDHPTPTQHVSAGGMDYTVITIEAA